MNLTFPLVGPIPDVGTDATAIWTWDGNTIDGVFQDGGLCPVYLLYYPQTADGPQLEWSLDGSIYTSYQVVRGYVFLGFLGAHGPMLWFAGTDVPLSSICVREALQHGLKPARRDMIVISGLVYLNRE